jgi:hypothetical protein
MSAAANANPRSRVDAVVGAAFRDTPALDEFASYTRSCRDASFAKAKQASDDVAVAQLLVVLSGRVVRMGSDVCLPLGSSSAPVHRPHPSAPLSCMDTSSQRVAAALSRMQ